MEIKKCKCGKWVTIINNKILEGSYYYGFHEHKCEG